MLKKTSFTILFSVVITALTLVICSSCNRQADKAESQKYLRAFDAEVTNHAKRILLSRGYQALTKILYLPGTPLPFAMQNTKMGIDSLSAYDLNKASGVYSFNEQTSRWDFDSPGSDSIPLRLFFTDRENKELELRMYKYTESESAFGMTLPTLMQAMILDKKNKLMIINYSATLKEGFPEKAQLQLTMGGYECKIELSTTFTSRETANVEMRLQITKDLKQLIEAELQAKAVISEYQTMYYNQLNASITAFPLEVTIRSGYEFGKWAGEAFFSRWNEQSNIKILTQDGRSLGFITLEGQPAADRVNLIMHYHDGSKENLEDLQLLVKSILNFKNTRNSS